MRRTLSLSLVCLVTLVAGCGDEESSSEGSGKPPANMCEAVAPAVPEDWKLTKTSAPRRARRRPTARWPTSPARPRWSSVSSSPSPAAASTTPSRSSASTYIGSPQEGDDEECTKTGPVQAGGVTGGAAARRSAWSGSEGVLWVTFRTNNPDNAAEAEDVLDDVEDAVSQD